MPVSKKRLGLIKCVMSIAIGYSRLTHIMRVFVDESGINLGMTRLFGRAVRGERAIGHKPRNTGQNVTLIGALSLNGLFAPMTAKGSTDTPVFHTYVTQVLVPQLWQGAIVVMDNLKPHKAASIRAAIVATGARERILATLFTGLISHRTMLVESKTVLALLCRSHL